MARGTAPRVTGLKVKDVGSSNVRRLAITLSNVAITMVDEAGVVAYGSKLLYTFAEGLIFHKASSANLTIVKSGAGINADFDGDFGLGTTAAGNNNALATTEQNLIPTTATPQAVAGAATAKGISTSTEGAKPLDGTAAALALYLNFLIDDADQDGGGTFLVSGTIEVAYEWVGDK